MTREHFVTDEQLGLLARRQAELFRRVREGTLPVDSVRRQLQDIIEGNFIWVDGGLYPLDVDYRKTYDQLMEEGNQHNRSMIREHNFPPISRDLTMSLRVHLVHFNHEVSTEGIHQILKTSSLVALDLQQLLTLGVRYPYLQQLHPVIALGSLWDVPHCQNVDVAALIRGSDRQPTVILRGIEHPWLLDDYFAAYEVSSPEAAQEILNQRDAHFKATSQAPKCPDCGHKLMNNGCPACTTKVLKHD